jgi:hypothetical protein
MKNLYMEQTMYIGKKLLFLVVAVFPAFLQGMDASTVADTESKAAAADRVKKSRYIISKRGTNDDVLHSFYAHKELSEDMRTREWGRVAEDIVAGCKTDALFADTVTTENIMAVCKELDSILNSGKANEYDFTRITGFLNRRTCKLIFLFRLIAHPSRSSPAVAKAMADCRRASEIT